MKKFINKHSDIIIAIIFIIVIPTALFYSIAAIVKLNLFNLSFLENKDNFILYFATMFASGISATITFIVLKITLEKSEDELKQQKKNLDTEYKRQINLKYLELELEILEKNLINLNNIEALIIDLYNISSFLKSNYFNYMIEVRKDFKELYMCTNDIIILSDRMNNITQEMKKNEYEKLYLSIKEFINDYQGIIKNPTGYMLDKEYKNNTIKHLKSYRTNIEKLYNNKIKAINNIK